MSSVMDDVPEAGADLPAVDERAPIKLVIFTPPRGLAELIHESAAAERSAGRHGDDPESVHLTTILSTLVDASLWEDLRRTDGTTYAGSLERAGCAWSP